MGEILLLFIIFCAIGKSIYEGLDAGIGDIIIMLFIVIFLHCITVVIVWHNLIFFFLFLFLKNLKKKNV